MGAVIADLDGVLVDTVKAHEAGWQRVAEELGLELSERELAGFRGVARKVGVERLLARSGRRADAERLMERKAELFRAEIRDRGRDLAVPGADRLLAELRALGLRLGVASASRHAGELLERAGLAPFVETVSDGWFAGPPKPDPAQLLDVARLLGVEPRECLVLEDAPDGLAAALAAEMIAFGIGPVARAVPGLAGHADSVADVTGAQLAGLVRRRRAVRVSFS